MKVQSNSGKGADPLQLIKKGEIESEDHGKETFPFWKLLTTEELIEIQGVAPINNLDELSALWPADDDPEELLNFILDDRYKRGRLAGKVEVE